MHTLHAWTSFLHHAFYLQGLCAQHLHNGPRSGLYRIRMAEQSVDALSLKDVQHGLENGQFTVKKPTSGKSDVWESFSCVIDADGKKLPFANVINA